jgi:hypothetical protein
MRVSINSSVQILEAILLFVNFVFPFPSHAYPLAGKLFSEE